VNEEIYSEHSFGELGSLWSKSLTTTKEMIFIFNSSCFWTIVGIAFKFLILIVISRFDQKIFEVHETVRLLPIMVCNAGFFWEKIN